MAISAYTGLPRHGKSYGVFEYVILPALKAGRTVYTNIPFYDDRMIEAGYPLPVCFDVKDIQSNPDWFQKDLPKGALLVLDECWRIWKSGMKATQVLEQHAEFLTMHGHQVGESGHTTEIVLVTQGLNQIASFVRELVETTYIVTKLVAIGVSTKYRVDIYAGAVTGQKPPKTAMIRQLYGTYKPEVYSLYKSQTMNETGEHGDESSTDDRGNALKGYFFKSIPVIMILCAVVIFFGLKRVMGFYGGGAEPVEVNQMTSTMTEVSQVEYVTPPKPQKPDYLAGRQLTIIGNMGLHPHFDYVVEAIKGENWFRLTKRELLRLGYTITPVNQCFMLLEINDTAYPVSCRQRSDGGLVNFDWTAGKDNET